MCLSLEHQIPSKTSEKMGYFDRVTVSSLHILYTANQETEGSQDWHFVPRSPFWRRAVRQRGYGLRLLIFKTANDGEQQSRSASDKKRRNRLQYIHKDPTGLINRAKRQV